MITSSGLGQRRQNSAYRSLLVTDCSPHSLPDPGPADEVLREILPEFFTAWDRDLCNAQSEIIARNDTESLYRFGHTIKGSMMQFGFPSLSTIGVDIMCDAERGDVVAASERMHALRQQLIDLRNSHV